MGIAIFNSVINDDHFFVRTMRDDIKIFKLHRRYTMSNPMSKKQFGKAIVFRFC